MPVDFFNLLLLQGGFTILIFEWFMLNLNFRTLIFFLRCCEQQLVFCLNVFVLLTIDIGGGKGTSKERPKKFNLSVSFYFLWTII